MAFPITSKVLIAGLIILVIVILVAFAVIYLLSKVAGPASHSTTAPPQGYNVSGHNSTGYNISGYNKTGHNSSVNVIRKGGPI